jgi:hypothetical protein
MRSAAMVLGLLGACLPMASPTGGPVGTQSGVDPTMTALDSGSYGSDTATNPTTPTEPDLSAACAALWPPDLCTGGCATAEEQVWADGFRTFLAQQWSLPRSEVDAHVKVRRVEVWGVPHRYATVDAELIDGWVRAIHTVRADFPGVPTESEAAAAFDPRTVPQVDLTAAPREWAEASAALADCEAELGVTFADPFCDAYVDTTPDRWAIRFDFWASSYDPDCAGASVGAFDPDTDSCFRTACYTYR